MFNCESICKAKYLKITDIVLFEKVEISHDGYDQYGPESNLYDYLVIIQREGKRLYEIFHKEYWYSDNIFEEYKPTNNCIFGIQLSVN